MWVWVRRTADSHFAPQTPHHNQCQGEPGTGANHVDCPNRLHPLPSGATLDKALVFGHADPTTPASC